MNDSKIQVHINGKWLHPEVPALEVKLVIPLHLVAATLDCGSAIQAKRFFQMLREWIEPAFRNWKGRTV